MAARLKLWLARAGLRFGFLLVGITPFQYRLGRRYSHRCWRVRYQAQMELPFCSDSRFDMMLMKVFLCRDVDSGRGLGGQGIESIW